MCGRLGWCAAILIRHMLCRCADQLHHSRAIYRGSAGVDVIVSDGFIVDGMHARLRLGHFATRWYTLRHRESHTLAIFSRINGDHAVNRHHDLARRAREPGFELNKLIAQLERTGGT
jgi:hypothetical protein